LTVTLGRYHVGIAGLTAVVVPVTFAAVVLRRRWLPDWSGSPARVAEAVLTLALLVAAAQLVGVLGLFRPGFLVATTVAIGAAAWRFSGRQGSEVRRPAPPLPDRVAMGIAAVITASVVGCWTARVAGVLESGMGRSDSLSYHGPMAARFVQEHSVVHPFFATNEQVYVFFPGNSELLHAIGILITGRDLLSPLLNLGWLVLALTAAWALGRPFGRGPATLAGAAVALATPVFVSLQPGEAFVDVVIVALFLAAAALLVNGGREPAPVLLAGLAGGLAAGTKVTAILPVAALTFVAIALVRSGQRVRTGTLWVAAVLAVGGLWYVRNFVAFGSPLPAVRIGLGPLALPSVEAPPHYSVAYYATDWDIWDRWFLPGLNSALGPAWWAVVGLAALGAALGLVQRTLPHIRAVSILTVVGALV
jgi:hypothetical protein